MHKIIIADDHDIVRQGVRSLFEQRSDVEIVAETADGLTTVSAIKRWQPSVALIDVSMPYVSGVEICIEAKRWSPDTRLIVFTGLSTGVVLQELIDEGVAGIVLKSESVQLLREAFEVVIAGDQFFSEEASSRLNTAHSAYELTSRERQILKLIVSGNTNSEIASLLSVSNKTVENHRTNLMKKLGVHSVSELMALAYRERLVSTAADSQ